MNDFLKNKNTAAIRVLTADSIQQANSGHPGAPMGMAELADVLWRQFLNHNPNDPQWINRDRFVLSNGHGSILLYSLLHLSGYDLSIEEIKNFRQLHSKTPGHPEYRITPGVETTTGPLGQGIGNAVGMALSEKLLADEFNEEELPVIDHFTYVFAGDGCLMEGVSHEVCSLAGTLQLGKLIIFYDDNGISIDGEVKHWFSEDVAQRYVAYGWEVIKINGHDQDEIRKATQKARSNLNQPTLIMAKTVIGAGSPNKAGTSGIHGAPLGDEEIAIIRKELSWEYPPYEIPDEVYQAWDGRDRGKKLQVEWQITFDQYREKHPEKANELLRRAKGELSDNWQEDSQSIGEEIARSQTKIATRKSSQICIEKLAEITPEFLGGSADLTGSNLTNWPKSGMVRAGEKGGRHINYGVREFGMASMMNGMTLHGGFIPFGGTFLTFSDYSRNAIRMASLMGIRVIHVFTHDSIGLGEDGPTHQAVEQTASLRLIPNLYVWRPADTLETFVAWRQAIERSTSPTALILTRQGLSPLDQDSNRIAAIERGGYVVGNEDSASVQIVASGSEVEIALSAQSQLEQEGIITKVVSMPCVEIFMEQDEDYRNSVINKQIPSLVVEAGVGDGWYRVTGSKTTLICMNSFGESAPGDVLYNHFGITTENLAQQAKKLV